MPAAGGATTLVASAQGGRGVHFARNDSRASTSRPTAACSRSRWMATTAARCSVSPASAPATTRRARMTFACRRTARARSSASRASTSSSPRAPAAKRSKCASRAGRDQSARQANVARRRRLSRVDQRRQGRHVGLGRAVLQAAARCHGAAEDRHRRRARALAPKGSVLLTGARIITMKGNEVIPQGDVLVTDNRIAAVGKRGSLTAPPGRARSTSPARPSCPASSMRTRTCGRRGLHKPRSGSIWPTSPTA